MALSTAESRRLSVSEAVLVRDHVRCGSGTVLFSQGPLLALSERGSRRERTEHDIAGGAPAETEEEDGGGHRAGHAEGLLESLRWARQQLGRNPEPRRNDARCYGVTMVANSRYRHSAFARAICRGVLQSGANRRGLATMKTAQRARDEATFSLLRL